MNRIYRLVWSDARRAWVAASELSSQRHRAAPGPGGLGSARGLLLSGLALCALAWHPASHAQTADDAKLDDLQGLMAKYGAPAPQAVIPVNVNIVAPSAVASVSGAAASAATASTATQAARRKSLVAGVRVRTSIPVLPTSQQMGSGVAVAATPLHTGGADVAALGQGLVSAVLPGNNDVADRNRSVVLATHAAVTSSLVDNSAPSLLGADGLVHVGTPAVAVGSSGANVSPVDATVGAKAAVLASNGDLVDAHAHVGVSVPALSSTPLVNANVNLAVGGELVSSLKPITGSLAAGNVGGVVAGLPATVDGVNSTVNGVAGGVTAGTPLAGVTGAVLPPVESTLHNVATTLVGAGNGAGNIGGLVSGVTSTVGNVLNPVTSGAGLGNVGGVVSGVTSTVGSVLNPVTGGAGLSNVGGVVSGVTSTVGSVLNPVTGGAGLGNVGGVVSGVTSTVGSVLNPVTGGTGLGNVGGVVSGVTSTVGSVLNPVTGGAGLSNVGGVVSGVTSTVGSVLNPVTGGAGLGNVGGVVSGVTSTVGSVLNPVTGGTGLGNVGGLTSTLPAVVSGATNTVTGVVSGVTAGTPLAGTVTGVVQPVTSTLNNVVGSVANTGSGNGLGGLVAGVTSTVSSVLNPVTGGAGLGNVGGVVSGVTSTVGTVLNPVTGGTGLGNVGNVVSGVTSTVGGVLGTVGAGGATGAVSSLPATVNGVTSAVTGIVGAVTAGTPLAGTTTGVLQPVTAALGHVVGAVAGTASGGLGGVLGSGGASSIGKVLPDVGKTVGNVTSTVGDVLAQPNGTGLTSVLGQGGTASSLLGNLTNTVADTANSVPGVQLGATGNGLSSGQNLVNAIPGASNLIDKALPGVASVLGLSPATTSASGGTGGSPTGVPVVPGPSAMPTGMIISNGGVVGTASSLLGTTGSALFNNTNGFVTSGGMQVNAANFTQGYQTVSVLGVPTVNLTPVGTALTTVGGAVLGGTGDNSHLTLIGSVKSDSYITNINNGAAGGLLGLLLPNGSPAWASTCANVLGVVQSSCWGVNAAQDYQVLMGDGATANGSKEVVIGTNASHTLPAVTAAQAFPGNGTNDPNNPTGVPTDDYAARLGHSVVIGDSASGTANAQTIIGANASASVANSVALGYASTATRGAQTGYAAYGLSAPQNSAGEVSIGAPGQERQITNVAAGSAATDAVNLAQLQAVSFVAGNAVQYDDATHATVTLDNTSSTDGGVTGGTVIANLHQGDISSASTQAINGAQMWHWTQDTSNIYSNYSLYNDIKNLSPGGNTTVNNTNAKYLTVNSTLANSTATGSNAMAVGPVAAASGNNAVALGNGASATADNSVALGSGSVADRANTVSVGSAGSERQITNVAAGTASTDAVNLGQMQASINSSTQGTVRYDTNSDGSTNYSSVTLGNGSSTATTIHNVANGVANSDAANVGQLNAGIQQAQNWAQNYTDQRFNQLNGQIQNVSNRANAGVAAGMAMAGLPQAYEPGRSMAAVSVGSFRGESSISVGVSTISQGGRWVYKLSGSADTRGDAGVSIGAGMQW